LEVAVRGPRRLLVGLAATTAVVTLNISAAGAAEAGAGAGPWCTGTSTVCHSWDSFHAQRLSHLRNDFYRQDAREACRRAISANTRCDVTRFDTHRHWTPWRAYTYGPLSHVFKWRGWRSWHSWTFWN
jgi:hypothetical protein